jgi:hypothetical protein
MAYMANKGSLNGKHLISKDAYDDLVSDPRKQEVMAHYSNYTKGGLNQFKYFGVRKKSRYYV